MRSGWFEAYSIHIQYSIQLLQYSFSIYSCMYTVHTQTGKSNESFLTILCSIPKLVRKQPTYWGISGGMVDQWKMGQCEAMSMRASDTRAFRTC